MPHLVRADAPPHPNQLMHNPDGPRMPSIAQTYCGRCEQLGTSLTCTADPVEFKTSEILPAVPPASGGQVALHEL